MLSFFFFVLAMYLLVGAGIPPQDLKIIRIYRSEFVQLRTGTILNLESVSLTPMKIHQFVSHTLQWRAP
eukprot:SAG11_NODE_26_length_23420_cov_40.459886_12_plen_69_part_00